jgi:tRNA threonylcarbamoyladenosine biosynthesis protein TsaE
MKKTILIRNLKGLGKFAERFARTLKGGDIIGLVGDLGSGKTTFCKHLAKSFGVRQTVKSPTFILLQPHKTSSAARKRTGIAELCHIDAYRLKNEDELFAIGFEDWAERRDAVILMEWADRIPSVAWLEDYREVRFDFGEDGQRVITLDDNSA